MIVANRYDDEELLGHLGMLDDVWWLFGGGGMGHFIVSGP